MHRPARQRRGERKEEQMKLVSAIIRPGKLQDIQDMLQSEGVERFTVVNVMGCGNQSGYTESYKNTTIEVNLLKKMKLEFEIPDEKVSTLIDQIIRLCRSGKIGDGKIFVMNIPKFFAAPAAQK
jgi:nitrogen regulatory protein P-II 1